MLRIIDNSPPPVALAELKAFLRIEGGKEDALLAALLRAATETVEAMLGQLLFERTVEERWVMDSASVKLGAEPVRLMVDVWREIDDGELAIVPQEQWRLRPGKHGQGHLDVTDCAEGAVIVAHYRAGTAANWSWVPEVLRLSVIRVAAHFHTRRDSTDDPGIPPAVKRMLAPWRNRRIL